MVVSVMGFFSPLLCFLVLTGMKTRFQNYADSADRKFWENPISSHSCGEKELCPAIARIYEEFLILFFLSKTLFFCTEIASLTETPKTPGYPSL